MNSSPHQVTRMIGLLFILASLSGCAGRPITTSQSTNRQPPTVPLQPAPKQTSTQPTLPATVAAVTAAPLPAPTDAAKAGAPFPINLSNTTLEPTEIAEFKKPNPVYYSIEDGQGTLHVIWQSFGGQLWHKQRPASGGWSEAVALPTSTGNRADQSSLLTAPDGKACVLWVDANDEFHPLCQTGGQWTEVSGMVRMKPVDRSVHFEGYQAQFDPQGDLIILTLRRGSPSDGYYLGDDRLFPQDNTSMDVLFQFRIDGQGRYHLAFVHGQDTIYRMSADQGKTWQKTTELLAAVERPVRRDCARSEAILPLPVSVRRPGENGVDLLAGGDARRGTLQQGRDFKTDRPRRPVLALFDVRSPGCSSRRRGTATLSRIWAGRFLLRSLSKGRHVVAAADPGRQRPPGLRVWAEERRLYPVQQVKGLYFASPQ